jgi:N-acetylglucosaminyldiphosphoundecaprenol N-acetyl-beta-D-mannosaminyltransferase
MPEKKFRNIVFTKAFENEAAKLILLKREKGSHFHFVAASTLVASNLNENLINLLNSGTNFCDSKPLGKFLDIFSGPFKPIRGSDVFRATIELSGPNVSHFFVGTDELTLRNLRTFTSRINPNFHFVGSSTAIFPQHFDITYERLMLEIESSKADIVWVGLGSPKQDYMAAYLANALPITAIGIGAAFDFVSGTKKEAPRIVQKFYLEWFFRLLSEPRRLWRRYLIGNLHFVILCLKEIKDILSQGRRDE